MTLCLIMFCLIGAGFQRASVAECRLQEQHRNARKTTTRLWLEKVYESANRKFWQGVDFSKRGFAFVRSKADGGWRITREKAKELWERWKKWRDERKSGLLVQPGANYEIAGNPPSPQPPVVVAATPTPAPIPLPECTDCHTPINLNEASHIKNKEQLFALWASQAPFEDQNFKKLYITYQGHNWHLSCFAKKLIEDNINVDKDAENIAKHYLDIVGLVWLEKPYIPDWMEAFNIKWLLSRSLEEISQRASRIKERAGYLLDNNMLVKSPQADALDHDVAAAVCKSIESDPVMARYSKIIEGLTQNFRGDVDNIIKFCDRRNKGRKFEESSGVKIKQISALYQSYPLLSKLKNYGENVFNLCGYYAAYFALCMLKSQTEEELINWLNDRARFEQYLERWRESINKNHADLIKGSGDAAIDSETIADFNSGLLSADEIKSIFEKNLADDISPASVVVQGHDDISQKINEFTSQEHPADQCFILNTTETGRHWITVLVSKEKGLIIADSIGLNRINFKKITKLYSDIFGAPTP